MLQIENVGFSYGNKRRVLDEISFELRAGTLNVFVGVNGCGKSTLLKCLAGILRPQTGKVCIDGKLLTAYSRKDLARKIAFMAQNPVLPPGFTVQELVECGRYPWNTGKVHDNKVISAVLEECGIKMLAGAKLTELSGGERQKAFLAMALAQEPEILLLDEPFSALDPAAVIELAGLLEKLKSSRGICIAAVLHDPGQALRYGDRIIGLRNGRICFDAQPAEALDRFGALYGLDDTELRKILHPCMGIEQ